MQNAFDYTKREEQTYAQFAGENPSLKSESKLKEEKQENRRTPRRERSLHFDLVNEMDAEI